MNAGTLPIARGGTGHNTFTHNEVVLYNSSNTRFESSGMLLSDVVRKSTNSQIASNINITLTRSASGVPSAYLIMGEGASGAVDRMTMYHQHGYFGLQAEGYTFEMEDYNETDGKADGGIVFLSKSFGSGTQVKELLTIRSLSTGPELRIGANVVNPSPGAGYIVLHGGNRGDFTIPTTILAGHYFLNSDTAAIWSKTMFALGTGLTPQMYLQASAGVMQLRNNGRGFEITENVAGVDEDLVRTSVSNNGDFNILYGNIFRFRTTPSGILMYGTDGGSGAPSVTLGASTIETSRPVKQTNYTAFKFDISGTGLDTNGDTNAIGFASVATDFLNDERCDNQDGFFTAQYDGYYHFTANLVSAESGTLNTSTARIKAAFYNATANKTYGFFQAPAIATSASTKMLAITLDSVLYLEAGDQVYIMYAVYGVGTPSVLSFASGSMWCGHMINAY